MQVVQISSGRGLGRGETSITRSTRHNRTKKMEKHKLHKLRPFAKDLRKNSTLAEKHLWYNLRANRLGHKFKRQVPIGNYIVDFACLQKRLVIELDGGQHMDNQEYDRERTDWLNVQGFRVLRFWNNEVLQQTTAVVEAIMKALSPTLSQRKFVLLA
jgi:very-short-patch-repair endonuclease